MGMDLVDNIVYYVLGTTYYDLGEQTVGAVKRVLVDTMGAAVAGSYGVAIDTASRNFRSMQPLLKNRLINGRCVN